LIWIGTGSAMASTNFVLDSAVTEALGSARGRNVRAIKIVVQDERLVLAEEQEATPEINADFAALQKLTSDSPCLIVVRMADAENTEKWLLVAWTPEASHVRDKMLYASSRAIVQKALNNPYFVKDYFVSTTDELDYDRYMQSSQEETEASRPYTEQERLQQEERAMEKDTSSKSRGMADLPIQLAPGAQQILEKFGAQDASCSCVELSVDDQEQVQAKVLDCSTPSGLQPLMADSPRYYALWFNKQLYFFMSVPENSHVKLKMKCATLKSSVIGNLKVCLADPDQNITQVEVRSPEDVTDSVGAAEEQQVATPAATAGLEARPAPPGGRKRTTQKQFDF